MLLSKIFGRFAAHGFMQTMKFKRSTNKRLSMFSRPTSSFSPFHKTQRRMVHTEMSSGEEKIVEVTKDLRGHEATVEWLTGVPRDQLTRQVIIYKPTPRASQQGTRHTQVYLRFKRDLSRKSENIMGWSSTTDPVGNMVLAFPDEQAAIAFATDNGWTYSLHINEGQDRVYVPADYDINFVYQPDRTKPPTDF